MCLCVSRCFLRFDAHWKIYFIILVEFEGFVTASLVGNKFNKSEDGKLEIN